MRISENRVQRRTYVTLTAGETRYGRKMNDKKFSSTIVRETKTSKNIIKLYDILVRKPDER